LGPGLQLKLLELGVPPHAEHQDAYACHHDPPKPVGGLLQFCPAVEELNTTTANPRTTAFNGTLLMIASKREGQFSALNSCSLAA
jgi:hypothetical protein